MKWLSLSLVAPVLAGCIVTVGDGRVHNTPRPVAQPLGGWDEPEVRFVVYREYFGCTESEIWTLRYYQQVHSIDADDLFFLCFVARQARVAVDVAFGIWWNSAARDHHRLVLHYGLSPSLFFVPVPAHVDCPPPYGRAYGYWRKRNFAAALSGEEYRSLIVMRIGCDYYGHSPEKFFQRTVELSKPGKVLLVDYHSAGRGRSNCEGKALGLGIEKPWQMSASRHASWKKDCDAGESSHQEGLKEKHGGPPPKPKPEPEDKDKDKGPGGKGKGKGKDK